MTTITIPINDTLNSFLDEQVCLGYAENKASLVRKAISKLREEELVYSIQRAKKEIRDGKGLKGDLRALADLFD